MPDREPRVLEIGRAEQLRAGGDIALIALGTMVLPALAAAETAGGRRASRPRW